MIIEATVVTLSIPTFLIVFAKIFAITFAVLAAIAVIVGFFYPSN